MDKDLRILALEDDSTDLLMIDRALRKGGLGFHSKRVETREDFVRELEENPPDLIVSDHGLPAFDGFSALAIAQEKCPEVPFLFVTGSQEEEVALEMFKSGATDSVPKNRLSHLVPAVQRALQLAEERARRRKAEQALRESQEHYQRLAKLCFLQGTNRIEFADPVTASLLDVVRRCLNIQFKGIGRIVTLSIDSRRKSINLKLDLKGEPAPIEFNIREYRLREENGAAFLELGIVETSREWINALLKHHSKRPRLEVTGWEEVIKALL
jgi:CheY-like chemotaxis protein